MALRHGFSSLVLLAGAVLAQASGPEAEGRLTGSSARDVRAAARRVDAALDAALQARGTRPNPRASDEVFLRRVYLDLIGRIPTLAEFERFVDSTNPAKREALIDELLDSPGYVSHTYHYFADLLRVKSRLGNQVSGEPYVHWLKQAIDDNVPYDQFVTELLTATGSAHARDNGATGYYLRDREMPEDNMANTMRVFAGTRMECAQCHNHPFDRWTQKQFFEMVAFTGGIQYRHRGDADDRQRVRSLERDIRSEHGAQAARAFRRMLRPVSAGVQGSGTGLARLPDDYQYEDAKPKDYVTAHALFGSDPEVVAEIPTERKRGRRRGRRASAAPEIESRAVYADWLVSPDNPRFTLVIANRMWKRVFGLGLIEPVDNLTDETKASHPELMECLSQLMVELDYDLVQFQRVLCNTKAYQRAASRGQPESEESYSFAGPLLRRMTAEQMWDSMLTLVVADVDSTLEDPGAKAERVYLEFEAFLATSDEEMMAQAERETLRYTDPDAFRAMRRDEGRERNSGRRREMADLGAELRELRRDLRAAKRAKDAEHVVALEDEIAERTTRLQARRGLTRASDLSSPARDGHLLRDFGQSDREQIEASHQEANVPQVLTLLNGFVDQQIVRGDSALVRAMAREKKAGDRIRTAYVAILGRRPSSGELSMWRMDVQRDGDDAYDDLLWALLNTNEFRFVQ